MEQINNGTAPVQQEKTFTQEQVNAIVSKRLAEAKSAREADLNRREMEIKAKELLIEKGLPKDLSTILRYDNDEELTAAVDQLVNLRGFKKDPEEQEKQILENRLPKGEYGGIVPDPLRAVFLKE